MPKPTFTLPPMSPNDLYASTVFTKGTFEDLVSYSDNSLLKEVDFESSVSSFNLYQYPPDRMEIRLIKDHSFSSKYAWKLGTVWFDSLPVMVFQRAGRYCEDHQVRFITDTERFKAMCKYLTAHIYDLNLAAALAELTPINQDEPRSDLDNFNGYHLNGYFAYDF